MEISSLCKAIPYVGFDTLSIRLGGSFSSWAVILRCHCVITRISPKHALGVKCLQAVLLSEL